MKARKLLTLGMRVLVVRPRVLLTTWPRSVPAKGHGMQDERDTSASRERRAGIQAERGEPGFKQANRDSSRETQAEMKFGRTAAPNCVLRTELRGADRTTCYGTECAPARQGIDTRCDSKACGRRARG